MVLFKSEHLSRAGPILTDNLLSSNLIVMTTNLDYNDIFSPIKEDNEHS